MFSLPNKTLWAAVSNKFYKILRTARRGEREKKTVSAQVVTDVVPRAKIKIKKAKKNERKRNLLDNRPTDREDSCIGKFLCRFTRIHLLIFLIWKVRQLHVTGIWRKITFFFLPSSDSVWMCGWMAVDDSVGGWVCEKNKEIKMKSLQRHFT